MCQILMFDAHWFLPSGSPAACLACSSSSSAVFHLSQRPHAEISVMYSYEVACPHTNLVNQAPTSLTDREPRTMRKHPHKVTSRAGTLPAIVTRAIHAYPPLTWGMLHTPVDNESTLLCTSTH
jgi:hypothetical protein